MPVPGRRFVFFKFGCTKMCGRYVINFWVVATQIFLFSPTTRGNDPIWLFWIKNGSKPPTRCSCPWFWNLYSFIKRPSGSKCIVSWLSISATSKCCFPYFGGVGVWDPAYPPHHRGKNHKNPNGWNDIMAPAWLQAICFGEWWHQKPTLN